jgi:hypothetical protein
MLIVLMAQRYNFSFYKTNISMRKMTAELIHSVKRSTKRHQNKLQNLQNSIRIYKNNISDAQICLLSQIRECFGTLFCFFFLILHPIITN